MNFASPWEAATRCTGAPEPGARALLAWLLETYREGFSLGIYNCRSVRGASTKSTHGEGRGVDYGLPMVGGRANPIGDTILAHLGAHGERLGVQCVIWNRRIYSAASPEGRPYTGVAPHYDHLHIELTRAAAARLTLATFRAVLGATEEDWLMNSEEAERLLTGIDEVVRDAYNSATQARDEVRELRAEVATLRVSVDDVGEDLPGEVDRLRRGVRALLERSGGNVENGP